MSDLVSEPVKEPPDTTNLGPPPSLEGVADGVGSCSDSAKSNADSPQTTSPQPPDLERVKSEQDASKGDEGVVAVDCSVSKGVI